MNCLALGMYLRIPWLLPPHYQSETFDLNVICCFAVLGSVALGRHWHRYWAELSHDETSWALNGLNRPGLPDTVPPCSMECAIIISWQRGCVVLMAAGDGEQHVLISLCLAPVGGQQQQQPTNCLHMEWLTSHGPVMDESWMDQSWASLINWYLHPLVSQDYSRPR